MKILHLYEVQHLFTWSSLEMSYSLPKLRLYQHWMKWLKSRPHRLRTTWESKRDTERGMEGGSTLLTGAAYPQKASISIQDWRPASLWSGQYLTILCHYDQQKPRVGVGAGSDIWNVSLDSFLRAQPVSLMHLHFHFHFPCISYIHQYLTNEMKSFWAFWMVTSGDLLSGYNKVCMYMCHVKTEEGSWWRGGKVRQGLLKYSPRRTRKVPSERVSFNEQPATCHTSTFKPRSVLYSCGVSKFRMGSIWIWLLYNWQVLVCFIFIQPSCLCNTNICIYVYFSFRGKQTESNFWLICEETLPDSYYGGWPRAAARILSQ